MIQKILNAYYRTVPVGRLEFLIGFSSITVIFIGLAKIYGYFVSIEHFTVRYLVGRSLLDLLYLLLLRPLVIARLRDIKWNLHLAYILVPLWLLSTRNMIIYLHLSGEPTVTPPYVYTGAIFQLAALVLLVALLWKRSNSNNALQSDA